MNANTDNANPSVEASGVSYVESLRRWILALLGIVCVGFAVLGAILPGLPATIFLIAAGYLFTRSCPRLEQLLIRNRFFAPYHRYLDRPAEMPWQAKAMTLFVMWTFISISTAMLMFNYNVATWVVTAVPVAGIVGTYFVALRRSKDI